MFNPEKLSTAGHVPESHSWNRYEAEGELAKFINDPRVEQNTPLVRNAAYYLADNYPDSEVLAKYHQLI